LPKFKLKSLEESFAFSRIFIKNYMNYPSMKEIGSGLIEKDGRYLLIKAKVGVAKGLWNNPGGHQDEGETIEETAQREVNEETGFNVEVGKLIGTYTRYAKKYVFEMRIIDGNLNLPPEEIEDAKWFTVEEVKNLENITFGAQQSAIDHSEKIFNQTYTTKRIP